MSGAVIRLLALLVNAVCLFALVALGLFIVDRWWLL